MGSLRFLHGIMQSTLLIPMAEFEGDLEAVGRLIKLVKNSPRRKRTSKKCSKREERARDSDGKVEGILAELKQIGISADGVAIAFNDSDSGSLNIVGPPEPLGLARELKWTAHLPLFEEARQSSINASLRLLEGTQALQCSYEAESPQIEQTLFQIRAGLITANDPRLAQLVAYAQKIGSGSVIFRRINDALHDAGRRKGNGSLLADISQFRLTIACLWTGFLLWLMSDNNIATFMAANALAPEGSVCSPSVVTKARNELGLVKSRQLLVKAVGKNFQWFFVKGYPPAAE